MKKVFLFLLLIVLFIGCEPVVESTVKEHHYKLVCLNDKLNKEERSSGYFFIIAGGFNKYTEENLYYKFMYMDKYSGVAYRKLDADNDRKSIWGDNKWVYIIEKDIPPEEARYEVKDYYYKDVSVTGSNTWISSYHYLIVPKGSILNTSKHKIDLE